jgi:SpoVK/Ycf46/Vps4 family AAA+-type ATPase
MDIRDEFYLPDQKLLAQITNDINKFLGAEKLYQEMGVIYKRGYLLYGEPGNGKTSFIRHLVRTVLPKDTHIIWMDEIPNMEMVKALCAIPTMKVFVIEELTTMNKNAYMIKELLEFLDGESSVSNSIVIATTNYPEELHQNLADRPSRFDLVYEIKPPTIEESEIFFERFLKRPLETGEVKFSGLTVSHIREVCLLHKLHNLTLQQAYEKVQEGRKKFKDNFVERKGSTGHYA